MEKLRGYGKRAYHYTNSNGKGKTLMDLQDIIKCFEFGVFGPWKQKNRRLIILLLLDLNNSIAQTYELWSIMECVNIFHLYMYVFFFLSSQVSSVTRNSG